MAKFRAIEKGYYGDVIHSPDHHTIFDAPDDFECSWAVPADDEPEAKADVSEDTLAAEEMLDNEADAAREDLSEDSDDVNEVTGVEVL